MTAHTGADTYRTFTEKTHKCTCMSGLTELQARMLEARAVLYVAAEIVFVAQLVAQDPQHGDVEAAEKMKWLHDALVKAEDFCRLKGWPGGGGS